MRAPISLPHRTMMDCQIRLKIYIGYESPSIIRHLEPIRRDLFITQFVDCYFDESNLSSLGGDIKKLEKNFNWNELSLSYLDSQTK